MPADVVDELLTIHDERQRRVREVTEASRMP
jgi:hypothetical protein